MLSAHKQRIGQYSGMELKDIIRAARKEKGLSQARLAELVGVNKSAVAQWELGSTRPNNDSMAAIRAVLSIEEQINPIGSAPYAGELIEDPDELALLKFWRSLTIEKKRAVVDLLHIGRPIRP